MASKAQMLRVKAVADEALKDAGIYIRVSTLDQGERTSPGSQRAKLLEKARRDGYRVLPEHVYEDHHTGKETARPEFERLRKDVKNGALQAAFALGVDRLSRKVVDAAIVAGEFKRYGCILDFVEMKNNDSAEGRFTFNMLASVAEYMGEKIVEKGRDGQMRLLLENRIPGGPCIFGHDHHPAEKGRRIKNEAEAAWVLKMFQMIDAGKTTYAVAVYLNEHGVRGKGTCGRPPAEWSHNTVRQLLKNRSCIGECHTRGKVIPVPRLVPDDLFYRVQKKIMENRKRCSGRRPTESLLSGYLHDEYDHRMSAKRNGSCGGKYRSYVCNLRSKPPQRRLCDTPQVSARFIEAPVFSLVWETITNPARLLRAARAFYQTQPKPKNAAATHDWERELATAKRAYNNIRRMCDAGHYEFSEKHAELNTLKRRITTLEAELRTAAPVSQMPEETALAALLRYADVDEEPDEFIDRRDILESLADFKVIYYHRTGEFVVTGKAPLGPAAGMGSNQDGSQGYDTSSIPASIPFYLKGRAA